MTKDLKEKLTFLIAAKVDHEDRVRNIRTTLSYLRYHFDADIIISEQDTSSKLHDICKAFKCRQAQLVYPYDGHFYDIPETYFNIINETKDLRNIDLDNCTLFNPHSVGGVVMFDREHYWKCGGANEHFKSVGYEDNEINTRFKKLGTKIARTQWPLWHLTHARGETSYNHNPHIKFNRDYYMEIESMTPDELKGHVDEWNWHK